MDEIGSAPVERRMQLRASICLAVLCAHGIASGDTKPTVRKLPGLIVMTPSPTQAPPPGLRLRTMVRPADRLWIGIDIPSHVPLELGELKLDLLDPTSDGFLATYRERYESCALRGDRATCKTIVKIFDGKKKETASIALDPLLSRADGLEVQDVQYVEEHGSATLYFNEACQTYSKEVSGKCSALVAFDVATKKVLWRTQSLVSNNYFLVVGQYLVAAYGFTNEPAFIHVVRRRDGKVMDRQKLAHTNFEMTLKGDALAVELYYTYGRANFRIAGFDGDAPKLTALALTPPDPNDKPKPYNPPLIDPLGYVPSATPF